MASLFRSKCIVLVYCFVLLFCGAAGLYIALLCLKTHYPRSVFIWTGSGLLILALIGLFAVVKRNSCGLLVFSSFTTVIFFLELVTLLFASEMRMHFETHFQKQMSIWMKSYKTDSVAKDMVDTVQWTLKCCGAMNGSEVVHAAITDSCCDRAFTLMGFECDIPQYKRNCAEAIKSKIAGSLLLIVVVILETLIVQWIALLASWYLAKEFRIRELNRPTRRQRLR